MKTVIHRFLTLDAKNIIPEVYFGLGCIYLVLVIATISSVRSQDIYMSRKILWVSFILLIPIAGMATYSLSCIFTADHNFLRSIGLFRSHNAGAFKRN